MYPNRPPAKTNNCISLFIVLIISVCIGCAPTRAPIPPGVIPEQKPLSRKDFEYGRAVLSAFSKSMPLSNNRRDQQFVEAIVRRLAHGAHADRDPWHTYILQDDSIVNAGATRGNHVFVWSGLLRTLPRESDVAAILAHEMGHVLAEHTRANPAEQINSTLSNAAGVTTRTIMNSTSGSAAAYGAIAQSVVTEAMKGFIVNPESQRQELEADQIGMFIMVESGYRPEDVVAFWADVQNDSRFGANSVEFLSSHPTTHTRLRALEKLLPMARRRYLERTDQRGKKSAAKMESGKRRSFKERAPDSPAPIEPSRREQPVQERGREAFNVTLSPDEERELTEWEITNKDVPVFDVPDDQTDKPFHHLKLREKVVVLCRFPQWYRVLVPVKGFVHQRNLRPSRGIDEARVKPCRRQ
jgi:Zn-dependent protease with chaperone function